MANKKPSGNEEEYFARQEADKRRQRAVLAAKALGDQERAELKALHHLRCPHCGLQLTELKFQGVQVDQCSGCQGLFLRQSAARKLIKEEGYWARMLNFFGEADEAEPESEGGAP